MLLQPLEVVSANFADLPQDCAAYDEYTIISKLTFRDGIVTLVIRVSSVLENLGITFHCCSVVENNLWSKMCFKRSVLFSRIYVWHCRSQRDMRTGIASCSRKLCTSQFCGNAASILISIKDFRSSKPICRNVYTNAEICL